MPEPGPICTDCGGVPVYPARVGRTLLRGQWWEDWTYLCAVHYREATDEREVSRGR